MNKFYFEIKPEDAKRQSAFKVGVLFLFGTADFFRLFWGWTTYKSCSYAWVYRSSKIWVHMYITCCIPNERPLVHRQLGDLKNNCNMYLMSYRMDLPNGGPCSLPVQLYTSHQQFTLYSSVPLRPSRGTTSFLKKKKTRDPVTTPPILLSLSLSKHN